LRREQGMMIISVKHDFWHSIQIKSLKNKNNSIIASKRLTNQGEKGKLSLLTKFTANNI
jgi:hypothetical protein